MSSDIILWFWFAFLLCLLIYMYLAASALCRSVRAALQLWCAGSRVWRSVDASHGLRYPAASGGSVLWSWIEPMSPALQAGFLTSCHQGSPCIPLIFSHLEKPFMCLLAICIPSLEKCIFWSTHFLVGLSVAYFFLAAYVFHILMPHWSHYLQIFSLIQ